MAALTVLAAGNLLWSQARGHGSTTRPMEIDVAVTDAAGRPVPGLTANDFEVLQSGHPQEITSVADGGRSSPAARFEIGLPYFEQSSGDRDRPTIVFVVDDLSLTPEAVNTIRKALEDLAGTYWPQDGRMAVVRTSGGSGQQEELTSDRTRFQAALPPLGAARSDGYPAPARADIARTTLRLVLDGLRDVAGQKAVVLFSENLRLFENPTEASTSLASNANRASVVFYTLDPRAFSASPADRSDFNEIPSGAGIGAVAKDSGGIFFDRGGDVASVLARVLEDQRSRYRITFLPEAAASDSAGQSLVNGITVRVKREGVLVRSRSAFPPADEWPSNSPDWVAYRTLPISLVQAGDIPIRLTPMFVYVPVNGPSLEVLLHIDSRGLTSTRNLAGVHNAEVAVVAVVFAPGDQPLEHEERSYAIHVPDSGMGKNGAGGITVSFRLPPPKPGPVLVEALARDPGSSRIGSMRQVFDFPDPASGRLMLSSILLSATGLGREEPGQTAAERIFRPGSILAYTYTIVNAHMGEGSKTRVAVTARVTCEGRVVFSEAPATVSWPASSASAAQVRTGAFRLHDDAAKGHYVLEVRAVDEDVEPRRQATQTVDFEVR